MTVMKYIVLKIAKTKRFGLVYIVRIMQSWTLESLRCRSAMGISGHLSHKFILKSETDSPGSPNQIPGQYISRKNPTNFFRGMGVYRRL